MTSHSARRWPLLATAVIGIALALAPVAFQMFSRAPRGGDMIEGFKPYMTTDRIDRFRTDLATIDAAHIEAARLRSTFPNRAAGSSPGLKAFVEQWPAINTDMSSMLGTMRANIGHYRGVAALPPFVLFPWFFVGPGLIIAGLSLWSLRARRGGPATRAHWVPLVIAGLAVVAAPAVFQMFSRAPGGAVMIDDFKPFMTTTKVTHIQGYFLTIGVGEGELRRSVVPELVSAGSVRPDETTAIATFNQQWPAISAGMAPMIGAMADNVGNFDAVAALPPFWMFPWFFVIPGLAVAALAIVGRPRASERHDDIRTRDDQPVEPQLEGTRS
ncbi:MAG: hypothetical protein QOC92_4762 [Acidimicrobiaceae bacterium]